MFDVEFQLVDDHYIAGAQVAVENANSASSTVSCYSQNPLRKW